MEKAPVSKIKNELSRYLRRVQNGERVLISDRGRVVAELSPACAGSQSAACLQRLVEAGAARGGSKGAMRQWLERYHLSASDTTARKDDVPAAGVLAALLREREEGR